MKEWKLKKVIQILTACLAMIVVLNVSGISMKTMQTIDINKKESKIEPTRFKSANGVRNTGNNIPDFE